MSAKADDLPITVRSDRRFIEKIERPLRVEAAVHRLNPVSAVSLIPSARVRATTLGQDAYGIYRTTQSTAVPFAPAPVVGTFLLIESGIVTGTPCAGGTTTGGLDGLATKPNWPV